MDVGEEVKKEWIKGIIGLPFAILAAVILAVGTNTIELLPGLLIIAIFIILSLAILLFVERKKSKVCLEQSTKISDLKKCNADLIIQADSKKQLEMEIAKLREDKIRKFIDSDTDPLFKSRIKTSKEIFMKPKKGQDKSWNHGFSDEIQEGERIKVVVAGDEKFSVQILRYTMIDDETGYYETETVCRSGKTKEWNFHFSVTIKGYYGVSVEPESDKVNFSIDIKTTNNSRYLRSASK